MLGFRAEHPGISFDVHTGNADLIKERLDSGLTDIGLLLEPIDMDRYDFVRLQTKERWGPS